MTRLSGGLRAWALGPGAVRLAFAPAAMSGGARLSVAGRFSAIRVRLPITLLSAAHECKISRCLEYQLQLGFFLVDFSRVSSEQCPTKVGTLTPSSKFRLRGIRS